MRRHHNPRYAPESLERKLSPSGLVAVTAEVGFLQTQATDAGTSAAVSYSEPAPAPPAPPAPSGGTEVPPGKSEGGEPPLDSPSFPGGPGVPA
jgi:hypothetical protein